MKGTRVTIDLDPISHNRLEDLKERTNASSKAEVIKKAIKVFDLLAEAKEKNAKLRIVEPDGTSTEVLFIL